MFGADAMDRSDFQGTDTVFYSGKEDFALFELDNQILKE